MTINDICVILVNIYLAYNLIASSALHNFRRLISTPKRGYIVYIAVCYDSVLLTI